MHNEILTRLRADGHFHGNIDGQLVALTPVTGLRPSGCAWSVMDEATLQEVARDIAPTDIDAVRSVVAEMQRRATRTAATHRQ